MRELPRQTGVGAARDVLGAAGDGGRVPEERRRRKLLGNLPRRVGVDVAGGIGRVPEERRRGKVLGNLPRLSGVGVAGDGGRVPEERRRG